MATDEVERVHYYQRQYLGAADFEAQQQYHRDMRRRHNLAHHTWGIVTGLELIEQPNECDPTAIDVFIAPGFAVDGFGREIVMFEPVKLDPSLFDAFQNLQHRAVWIEYFQRNSEFPRPGYQVCQGDDYSRIEETYRIVIEPAPPTHDPVDLSGNPAMPPAIPDESVPEQEFPDDAVEPLWLVALGFVRWDGVNAKFVPVAPDKAKDGRHYVGVVAEEVMGPAGKLFLRDRASPHPLSDDPSQPGVAAEVEGSLQVDRLLVAKKDEQIHGGRLFFENNLGGDDGAPLWLQRLSVPGSGAGADLRLHIGDGKIGDPAAAGARLTVGNLAANGKDEAVILDVKGDNTVDIPTGVLDFGKNTRQTINLFTRFDGKAVHGIGVQTNTTYFRSQSDFCWFQQGVHSDNQGDPGGGSLAMRLDQDRNLSVTGGLSIGGNLHVSGSQNLVKVKTATFNVTNEAPGLPAHWTMTHTGEFAEIYAKFVTLQGYNIFGLVAAAFGKDANAGAIPQHVFARITGGDNNSTSGDCFCSESANNPDDNSVLFTVVIMGKGVL